MDCYTDRTGEYESLNAINSAVPDLCPRAIAHGDIGNGDYFLATEFLELGGGNSRKGSHSGDTLAAKLAKLHCMPAPSDGRYGFPETTCWYVMKQQKYHIYVRTY